MKANPTGLYQELKTVQTRIDQIEAAALGRSNSKFFDPYQQVATYIALRHLDPRLAQYLCELGQVSTLFDHPDFSFSKIRKAVRKTDRSAVFVISNLKTSLRSRAVLVAPTGWAVSSFEPSAFLSFFVINTLRMCGILFEFDPN